MIALSDSRVARLITLLRAALAAPSGKARITLAIGMGAVCHALFAAGVLAMMIAMFFGLSESFGKVAWPFAVITNLLLVAQFPIVHSWLLTGRGGRWLASVIPGSHGVTLSTTTYAIIASAQLLALFTLWTPSGVIWWRAEGSIFWILSGAYATSWLLVGKASFDAGLEVQSGALGWVSLLAKIRPIFPDMPTKGLFAVVRQPIYVAFTLTLWTVPIWTPDQFALAVCFTVYCLCAPKLKERRFKARYGQAFEIYQAKTPYLIPQLSPKISRDGRL